MNFKHENLEKYEYIKTLGSGAQGRVVKVKDKGSGEIYALKLLSSSTDINLFAREIRTLQKLNHKNVISINDAHFINKEGGFILMQYMKHGSLSDYLERFNNISLDEKLLLLEDSARALQYIHDQGFMHRDIKPQNIFIHDDGNGAYACLGDFGIVKELGQETLTKTAAGVGTMIYLPAEVLNGDEKQSQHTDIYALGMSMYEVLTKTFAYDTSAPIRFMEDIVNKTVIAPSEYNELIPKRVNEVCLRAIAKRKSERYQSITDFLEDLKKTIQTRRRYLRREVLRDDKEKQKEESTIEFRNKRLRKYEYIEKIGNGRQGEVIKVQERSGGEIYALKLLSKKADRKLVEREIEFMKRAEHKHIIDIYDADLEDEEQPYILMQYMKCGTLLDYIEKHTTVDICGRLLLMRGVLYAVKSIHEKGIIHCDINPQNIYVTHDGKGTYGCLGDFGIAKDIGNKGAKVTGGGIGSMRYTPFEVLNGNERRSESSDVYALGVCLYEALAGKHPYDDEGTIDYAQEFILKQAKAPSKYNALVTQEVDTMCLQAIAKKKEDRYSSIDFFLDTVCNRIEQLKKEKKEGKTNSSNQYYQRLVKEEKPVGLFLSEKIAIGAILVASLGFLTFSYVHKDGFIRKAIEKGNIEKKNREKVRKELEQIDRYYAQGLYRKAAKVVESFNKESKKLVEKYDIDLEREWEEYTEQYAKIAIEGAVEEFISDLGEDYKNFIIQDARGHKYIIEFKDYVEKYTMFFVEEKINSVGNYESFYRDYMTLSGDIYYVLDKENKKNNNEFQFLEQNIEKFQSKYKYWLAMLCKIERLKSYKDNIIHERENIKKIGSYVEKMIEEDSKARYYDMDMIRGSGKQYELYEMSAIDTYKKLLESIDDLDNILLIRHETRANLMLELSNQCSKFEIPKNIDVTVKDYLEESKKFAEEMKKKYRGR